MDDPGEPQELADGHILGESADIAVLGLGSIILALVVVVVLPRSRGDVDCPLFVCVLVLAVVVVVSAAEMTGRVECRYLGPVDLD